MTNKKKKLLIEDSEQNIKLFSKPLAKYDSYERKFLLGMIDNNP
jgi:hypothetical protein